jgi:Ser/Thr protein kinase RdoA (MazF antagonist)
MRIEPHDLNLNGLLDLLHDRYLLDAAGLTFVPQGIDSWSYVATCNDGSRAFVKLTRHEPTGTTTSEMPLMAALAARGLPVPRPMADLDGAFASTLDGYDVQVLEYIAGRTLEDESDWPDDLYSGVARIVAAVHSATSDVRSLLARAEDYALPFLPAFETTLAALQAGSAPLDGEQPMIRLRELIAPRVPHLKAAIDRLRQLRDIASVRRSEAVLCHTDIWGSNLLLSSGGTLHLLDWGGALIGPPESDLFMFAGTTFFPSGRFGWFLDQYETAFRPARLEADTFGFYLYKRNVEDLAGFVASISAGRTEAMAPDAALSIVAGLLDETAPIEDQTECIREILVARRSIVTRNSGPRAATRG